MYRVRYARRSSGRYPAKDFLDDLETKDGNSWDKFMRAFELFRDKGPQAVAGLYKALQTQSGVVQFTIWKYRILGFRVGDDVFLTNGFKKDQNETPPGQLKRAHAIKNEHLQMTRGENK